MNWHLLQSMEIDIEDLPYHTEPVHESTAIRLVRTDIVPGSLPLRRRRIREWIVCSEEEWIVLREQLMPLDDVREAYEIYAAEPTFFPKELEMIKRKLRNRGMDV